MSCNNYTVIDFHFDEVRGIVVRSTYFSQRDTHKGYLNMFLNLYPGYELSRSELSIKSFELYLYELLKLCISIKFFIIFHSGPPDRGISALFGFVEFQCPSIIIQSGKRKSDSFAKINSTVRVSV